MEAPGERTRTTPTKPDPMITIPADAYTGQLDLLLADGTVVYMDGCSRWHAVHPDGTETYLGRAAPPPPPSPVSSTHLQRPTNTER